MTSYRPKVSQQLDSKREEFRKYLEHSGVTDALSNVLVALFEEPEKPLDALEYIKNYLGVPNSLQFQNEMEELQKENMELKIKLDLMEKKH